MPQTTVARYAAATSTLALLVALGGTSYAAVQLPKNSVSAKQIKTDAVRTQEVKDGSVGSPDIGDGAVTGADIADGAIGAADLSQATLSDLREPRAYGVFTSAGQLVAGRSRNVTVTKVPATTGFYCVTPTPGSGIDPTRTTIVATPDFDDGSGFFHSVMVKGAGTLNAAGWCPGGFGLLTNDFDDNTNAYNPTNMAVSFVIP
jgi:hypothetical protein